MTHVVMYTRQGCHLCDIAHDLLKDLDRTYAMKIEMVDVDSDADLVQRYGERVPVLVMDGRERFWGQISRVLLERYLRAKSKS